MSATNRCRKLFVQMQQHRLLRLYPAGKLSLFAAPLSTSTKGLASKDSRNASEAPSSGGDLTEQKPALSIFDQIVNANFGLKKAEKREVKEEVKAVKEDAPLDSENINTIFYSKYKCGVTNMTESLEGTYVSINKDDVKKFLPEGLPREISEEFRFTRRSEWMVRDATKVLYNFIEAFDKKSVIDDSAANTVSPTNTPSPKPPKATGKDGKTASSSSSSSSVVPADILDLQPGLTDRQEWPTAYLKTTIYGHQIPFDKSKKSYVAREIVESIREKYNSGFDFNARKTQELPDKIVISGKKGSGKTFALAQAVIHARARGWIVMYVPNGWSMVHDGAYVEPINPSPTPISQEVAKKKAAPYLEDTDTFYAKALKVKQKAHDAVVATPSFTRDIDIFAKDKVYTSEDTIFDNCEMSASALRGFWQAHGPQLSKIPINNKEAMKKYAEPIADFKTLYEAALSVPGRDKMPFRKIREIIESDEFFPSQDKLDMESGVLEDNFKFQDFKLETLEDLTRLGVALRNLAGLCFIDLIAELKNLNIPESPVMLAVDQYNVWDAPSIFSYDMKSIPSKRICVPHALNFVGTTKKASQNFDLKNGICIAATSHLHSEGRNVIYELHSPAAPLMLEMPVYSKTEYLSAIAMYQSAGQIDTFHTLGEVLTYRMDSGSNPHHVRKNVPNFFLPIVFKDIIDPFTAMTPAMQAEVEKTIAELKAAHKGNYTEDDAFRNMFGSKK